VEAVEKALSDLGARSWQVKLVGPALAEALLEKEPVPVAVNEDADLNTADDGKEVVSSQES
jgi:hypothetical protein